MPKKPVEKSGSNNVWITPPRYVARVGAYDDIGLDPCTEKHNPSGAATFFTEEDDGLIQDWSGHGLVYVNPPYSTFVELDRDDYEDDEAYKKATALAKQQYLAALKDIGEELFGVERKEVSSLIVLWALKIHQEVKKGVPLIALLPCGARFSTRYWQKRILCTELSAACFVLGRIPFIGPDGKPASGNIYDSIFYGYNVDAERFAAAFASLGVCFEMSRARPSALSGFV